MQNKLSIAVVGVGRVGTAFSYQLAKAGHNVTVIARPGSERLLQLQRDNGITTTTGEYADVVAMDHLDETKAYDHVIVTVLASQIASLLPSLRRSKARNVHFMFVTPQGKQLAAAIGSERATFGMAAVVSLLDKSGRLKLKIPRAKAIQGNKQLVKVFNDAGMPSRYEPDAARWLRSQAPLTAAMLGVTIAGMKHKRGATWQEAKIGAQALRAGFSIIGETPYPRSKMRLSKTPLFIPTFIMFTVSRSGFRQVLGESTRECQGLIDLLTIEGEKLGLNRAVNSLVEMRP